MSIVADLHTHSHASDGSLNPRELVDLASSRGLQALALTDHDTLSGVPDALRTSVALSIRVISGIEISAAHDPGTLHILGYFPSLPPRLEESLDGLQRSRRERIPRIVGRLRDLGMELCLEDVLREAGCSQPGRPHVARAMLKRGFVGSFDEAFDTYLRRGRPAYVPKERMEWGQAIALIREHGGMAVLAHPCTLDLDGPELHSFAERLRDAGLAGMEVWYPDHDPGMVSLYADMAADLGLVPTGGSDFHGIEPGGCLPGDHGVDARGFDLFWGRLTGAVP
ncbi:MAG TPA: PHP domain-containing protein [Deltaproteobacteria bacterium]|nr:PHP domain-containing protein [Deltaproteobacteria bacterium]